MYYLGRLASLAKAFHVFVQQTGWAAAQDQLLHFHYTRSSGIYQCIKGIMYIQLQALEEVEEG